MATTQDDFKRFKAICVPLLGSSKLSPSSLPTASTLLSNLIQLLRGSDVGHLSQSLISYIFLPLSTILQRNLSADIPDQVLEKLLLALGLLCESWWWSCDLKIWEQIFMLCGAVIGGIESKGKGKIRDDETKEAAVRCLVALLHERSPQDAAARSLSSDQAHLRTIQLQELTQATKFVPILGQTLDSILRTTESSRPSLQRESLQALYFLIYLYAPDYLIPTVLPGVISGMTRASLGSSGNKGWANGDIVGAALKVMQIAVVKAIGDDICIRDGAIPRVENLEDLATFSKTPEGSSATSPQTPSKPFATPRTPSWLRGTASQLHIAINALSPLVKHPTPSALYALVYFSAEVLPATSLTLTQTQPVLLSFLLSLSTSDLPNVAAAANTSLKRLLKESSIQSSLLQTLMRLTTDNLSSLPRLLSMQSDARVEHVAGLITAVCQLSLPETDQSHSHPPLSSISRGIGKLLGPGGGIEKWGWSLLTVLEFVDPPVTVTHTSGAQLMLESNQDSDWVLFPELALKHISSHDTRRAIENMFRALGRAGGDTCLFSVEWFVAVGRSGTQSNSVAAMWCACRLLEGISSIDLSSEASLTNIDARHSKRLEKQARGLARSVTELWDNPFPEESKQSGSPDDAHESELNVQHQKGLVPLHETLKIIRSQPTAESRTTHQPMLHRTLCLQLIAISAGILKNRFISLFIFTIYPILHSIVSPASFLSYSGLAALNFITVATSYASPANLLLSNFDYALDSVSRRLTRRWLDIDATKVLVILIRLVGPDVVDKAGDVVEECFDRLDAYHGYGVIVDGLIEVLVEVVNVIEMDVKSNPALAPPTDGDTDAHPPPKLSNLSGFFEWLPCRNLPAMDTDDTDYGPAPRRAWNENGDGDANDEHENQESRAQAASEQPSSTPSQTLTKQIISRSLYFLTHESPVIRARILTLLSRSVPVLPESALLPSIHSAWPFVLNRLADRETFVVSAGAALIEALVIHVGSFMYRRIWDDVWPRFRTILKQLDAADSASALARRDPTAAGTKSAYTHSHRLYRSLLQTMTAVVQGVHPHEPSFWEVLLLFRRFLNRQVHEDLQRHAKELYLAASESNPDTVWLVLHTTIEETQSMRFMNEKKWSIEQNATDVLRRI